jgi:hypothetical protein
MDLAAGVGHDETGVQDPAQLLVPSLRVIRVELLVPANGVALDGGDDALRAR